ncbi:MAG TPA: ABC transporter permease [Vicinamibacterales bacterium]|nr:ABC transporter permease [Vicinamibacterales bacterium]
MSTIWQDIAVAVRLLRRTPAFAMAAALTLALGVGVNTAVFSVINAVMLKPLPVAGGDRLFAVVQERPAAGEARHGASAPDLSRYPSLVAPAFDGIAGYDVGFVTMAPRPRDASRVLVTWVTGSYFPFLEVQPSLGRLLGERDVVAGKVNPIAVLGYSSWQQRFGGDPAVVGRQIAVNGRQLTVVGVAPKTFRGTFAFTDSELYLPMTWEQGWPRLRTQHTLARLRPAATLQQGQAAMHAVARQLARDEPDDYTDVRLTLVPERLARPEEEFSRFNSRAGVVTFALVALVLMVAGMNVANLLLSRGQDRRRELAIRAALGAGRARLVRQLLIESLVLAAIGGAVGVPLARWTASWMATIRLPGDKPIYLDFQLDTHVLLYAVAVAVLTGLAVGLAPAFQSTRVDVNAFLREGGRTGPRAPGRARIRGLLIVAQMSACVVLLVAAGLFTRSLRESERIQLGFDPQGVLNVSMDVQQLAFDEARGRAFFERLEERVRTLPGVDDVAFAYNVPLGYIRLSEDVEVAGDPRSAGRRPMAGVNWVSPGYFRTMGIRILEGRGFSTDRDPPGVAVVNRQFATVAWPGQSAIGRRFRTEGADGWIEVIGVSETGKYDYVFEDPQPYIYYPLDQWATGADLRTLHVRTRQPPERLAPAVERVIKDLAPDLALFDVMSMERALGGGLGFFLVRTAAMFASILGLLAVTLAVVGLYGVVAYAVGQRTREFGVRMALGAARADIARLVLGHGLSLVSAGIVVGMAASLFASRFLTRFLFGVPPHDLFTFATVALLLGAVALFACTIPAWRATSVDPATALRDE